MEGLAVQASTVRRCRRMGGASRRDVAVACACAAVVAGCLLAVPASGSGDSSLHVPSVGAASWWAGLAVLLMQSAALYGRSTRPRTVLLVVAAAVPVGAACRLDDAIGLTTVAVFVAVYTAVSLVPLSTLWPALAAAGVLVASGQALSRWHLHVDAGPAVGDGVLQALGAVVIPLVVALFVVARRDSQRARQDRLLAVAGEREARLEAAVAHERVAMARELHDIAAHHLSGIAVMTAAIGPQIDRDPAGAKVAVAQVRAQSRILLRDLRSLVELLRDEQPVELTASASRQQTLVGISELVADASATGMSVELTVLRRTTGDDLGDGVGPLAQLAAYRIVQESLANAARHAPGARCRVGVDDRSADAVAVTVRNDAAPSPATVDGGGFGLVGMRERAELTGADLAYGPLPDGGWQVTLSLPRSPETLAAQEKDGEP